MKKDNSKS